MLVPSFYTVQSIVGDYLPFPLPKITHRKMTYSGTAEVDLLLSYYICIDYGLE
jgi:hypothetical protein